MTPLPPPVRRWWISLDRLQHTIVKLIAYAATMTVVVISLVIAVAALAASNTNSTQLHGSCDFLRSIAAAPVNDKTSPLGLSIVNGAKHWFAVQHCSKIASQ